MKSLRESLFDRDLVTKDIIFGSLFELDKDHSNKTDYGDKRMSAQKIKLKTHVSGSDKNDIIFNGILKIIQKLPINNDILPSNPYFTSNLQKTIRDNVFDLFLSQIPGRFRQVTVYMFNGRLSVQIPGVMTYYFKEK